jgi:hypothetical protein
MEQTISQFIASYVPGFNWLVFLIASHLILSTIAHIIKKDFDISQWPKFLYMWLLFMVGIIAVNGVVAVASILPSASILLPIVNILQGMVYVIYFSYYLDNIFKILNIMGLTISALLLESIRSMSKKVLKTFTTGGE